MKKLFALLFLLAACGPPSSSAMAEFFSGGNATMDVPDGWTSEFKKSVLDEFRLTAPGNVLRMAIMWGPSVGMTPEQGAEMIAKKLGGTEPASTRNPGMYAFEANGGVLRVMTLVHGTRMMVIIESGTRGPLQDMIGHIIKSLASSDKDEQAMFDLLKPFF